MIAPAPHPGCILVVDISSAQGERPPWQAMRAAGVDGIMVNAGEGETFPATTAAWDLDSRGGAEAGFSIGGYHVFRPDHEDPTVQSRRFRRIAFDRTALNPCCDFEEQCGIDGTLCVERAVTFGLDVQQLFGKRCLMYLAPGFLASLNAHPDAIAKLGQFPLWLADYRDAPHVPAPWSTWSMWQFDDGHRVRIADCELDLSWFKGDEIALARMGASSAGEPVDVGRLTLRVD